jgi:hypothetical protein
VAGEGQGVSAAPPDVDLQCLPLAPVVGSEHQGRWPRGLHILLPHWQGKPAFQCAVLFSFKTRLFEVTRGAEVV